MRAYFRFHRPLLFLTLSAGLPIAAGCGTGAYEARLQAGIQSMNQAAQFTALHEGASPIEGATVTIRLPKAFTKGYTAATPDPDGGGAAIDPRRVQPPFLPLPGFKYCYEATAKDQTGAVLPYYVYVAAPTSADVPAGTSLADNLRDKLAATFPGAAWEDASCASPAGQPIAWRRIKVTGQQLFLIAPGQYSELPGVFQLYLYEGQDVKLLVGWRTPDTIAAQADLDRLAQLTAGSIAQAAAPAAGG